MKRLVRTISLAAVLMLAVLTQPARADYPCVADTPLTRLVAAPQDIGSRPIDVSTTAGEATGWWCLDPITAATPPGKVTFSRWYHHALNEHRGHPDLRGAFKRVMASANFLEAVNGEMRAGSIAVAAGSQKDYEIKVLRRNACIALNTPPYLVPIDPPPEGACGPAPVPPGQVPDVYRTPTTGSIPIYTYAAGRLTGVTVRKAPNGAPCNCTITATSGTKKLCSIGLPNEVAECVKQ